MRNDPESVVLPTLRAAGPGVRAAAESAQAILVRLGARPYLERLEHAMARKGTAASPGAGS
jgi:hypothetical protein